MRFFFKIGLAIRKTSFRVGNDLYEIVDHHYPLKPHDNCRELKIVGTNWYSSRVYLNRRKEWAYLDESESSWKK